jgi:hypothetical protein
MVSPHQLPCQATPGLGTCASSQTRAAIDRLDSSVGMVTIQATRSSLEWGEWPLALTGWEADDRTIERAQEVTIPVAGWPVARAGRAGVYPAPR